MPANVETMFSVRETPWHGLGRIVMEAPASREALELAGLDWQFWCQGRNDPCSGGLPEHPEFGSRFCKAYLDGKAHRKRPAPGAECPRNFAACQQLHGRTWKGNL